MPALDNVRWEQFAQHYAINGHSWQAGQQIGVSTRAEAYAILNRAVVADRVQEILHQRFNKAGITAERTLKELARIAFSDIRDLYDPATGELLPVHELSDDTAAVVSKIKVEIVGTGTGNARQFTVVKTISTADKMAALNLLARHFKIVGDVDDGVNAFANALADRLNQAKRRDHADTSDARIVDPTALPQVDPDDPTQVLNPSAEPRGMRLEYGVPDDPSNGQDVSAPRMIVPRRDPSALHSPIPQAVPVSFATSPASHQGADDEDFR